MALSATFQPINRGLGEKNMISKCLSFKGIRREPGPAEQREIRVAPGHLKVPEFVAPAVHYLDKETELQECVLQKCERSTCIPSGGES